MFEKRGPAIRSASQRAGIVAAAIIGTLTVTVSAYAYINAGPSTGGSSRVSTGKPLRSVKVSGNSNFTLALDQPVDLYGTITNDNTFRVSISKIKVTILGIGAPAPSAPPSPSCSITPGVNFFLTDAVPSSGRFFTAEGRSTLGGAGIGDWHGGRIEFRSSPSIDQTPCLGRRITLRYEAVAA